MHLEKKKTKKRLMCWRYQKEPPGMYRRAEHSELPQMLTDRPSFQRVVKSFYAVKTSDVNKESRPHYRCVFIASPLLFWPRAAMWAFFQGLVLCLSSSFLACVLSPFNRPASTLSSHHLLCLSPECFQAGRHH